MRSIVIFFPTATGEELTARLNDFAVPAIAQQWVFPETQRPVLYIYTLVGEQTEDHARYVEPSDWAALVRALGRSPHSIVGVDVSGRVDGTAELKSLLEALLEEFPGVVQDDYTEHCWTLDEISRGDSFDGHPFFDTVGWYEAGKRRNP